MFIQNARTKTFTAYINSTAIRNGPNRNFFDAVTGHDQIDNLVIHRLKSAH